MENLSVHELSALIIAVSATALWLLSLKLKDASIVDIFWGYSYGLVAIGAWASRGQDYPQHWVAYAVFALVLAWAGRLGTYLLRRNRAASGEDPRYQAMRRYHGKAFWWRSLFTVFTFQGVLIWLISMPIQVGLSAGGVPAAENAAYLGLALATLGFYIEARADMQLARFRMSAKKGALLKEGLWARCRHPNYFGDVLFWYGIYIAIVAATPEAIWTIFAPIGMHVLIYYVSGVAMKERYMQGKKGYKAYAAKTNKFIPKLF